MSPSNQDKSRFRIKKKIFQIEKLSSFILWHQLMEKYWRMTVLNPQKPNESWSSYFLFFLWNSRTHPKKFPYKPFFKIFFNFFRTKPVFESTSCGQKWHGVIKNLFYCNKNYEMKSSRRSAKKCHMELAAEKNLPVCKLILNYS